MVQHFGIRQHLYFLRLIKTFPYRNAFGSFFFIPLPRIGLLFVQSLKKSLYQYVAGKNIMNLNSHCTQTMYRLFRKKTSAESVYLIIQYHLQSGTEAVGLRPAHWRELTQVMHSKGTLVC